MYDALLEYFTERKVSMAEYNPQVVRQDFPLISHYGDKLSFLDNAASSQRPASVIQRMWDYESREHANIHRGLYELSEKATQAYEDARVSISQFIGAADQSELIFTRGCTEAINLVAMTWGIHHLDASSEIILTMGEHHAAIVPWQILAQRLKFRIRFLSLNSFGVIDLEELKSCLNKHTRFVSCFHVSNVLGTVNPIEDVISIVRERSDALVLVDGAQAVPHLDVNVQEMGVDFYTFSSHKMCGPTGIGALWGRRSILDQLPPYHGGGDMIETVSCEGFTLTDVPHRFEAGTPPICAVLGWECSVKYLKNIDRLAALNHDISLGSMLLDALSEFEHIDVWISSQKSELANPIKCFTDSRWVGIVSLHHRKIHVHDLACYCDSHGVAVRAGHHCAMPLHGVLNLKATLRASPYLYNVQNDIEKLVYALKEAEKIFL